MKAKSAKRKPVRPKAGSKQPISSHATGKRGNPPARRAPLHGAAPKLLPMKRAQSANEDERSELSQFLAGETKRKQPAPLDVKWSIDEPQAILDYLHGDTPTAEVEAACYYEYARASEILRKARREYDPNEPEDSAYRALWSYPEWVADWPALAVWTCRDYPALPWRALDKEQRESILPSFRWASAVPLIPDARRLAGTDIFDRLKRQAEEARKSPMVRGVRCPPMIGDGALRHVVISLNYKEGIEAVKEAFSTWLGSEFNTKLFNDHHKLLTPKQNPHSPDRWKGLLKCLAAWRLYDELKFKGAQEWTRTHCRSEIIKEGRRLRPFFRAVRGAGLRGRPLFKESRQWKAAKAMAEDCLKAGIEKRRKSGGKWTGGEWDDAG